MGVGSSRHRDYAYDIWNFQPPSLQKRLWLVSTTPATYFLSATALCITRWGLAHRLAFIDLVGQGSGWRPLPYPPRSVLALVLSRERAPIVARSSESTRAKHPSSSSYLVAYSPRSARGLARWCCRENLRYRSGFLDNTTSRHVRWLCAEVVGALAGWRCSRKALCSALPQLDPHSISLSGGWGRGRRLSPAPPPKIGVRSGLRPQRAFLSATALMKCS